MLNRTLNKSTYTFYFEDSIFGEAMMNRRGFMVTAGAAALNRSLPALAQALTLKQIYQQLEEDPSLVENSWLYREPSVSRGVGHGTPSTRILSDAATRLIINFEVAGQNVYNKRYTRPIWPKGASGVTIGIGYDLRFANQHYIDRDWPMLNSGDRSLLAKVATLSGDDARAALPKVQSVIIDWPTAQKQFLAFLPYPTKQTEDAFPNCAKLPDDCFGALVSLVYNRGPALPPHSKSRQEMVQIRNLMQTGRMEEFRKIPDRLRAMERLWKTPDSRGLVTRREAEALLFEQGLPAA